MERWYTLASWSFHVARTSFRRAPAAFHSPAADSGDEDVKAGGEIDGGR